MRIKGLLACPENRYWWGPFRNDVKLCPGMFSSASEKLSKRECIGEAAAACFSQEVRMSGCHSHRGMFEVNLHMFIFKI